MKLTNAALDSVHFTGAGKNGFESAEASKEVLSASARTSSGIPSRSSSNKTERKMRAASSCIVYESILTVIFSLYISYRLKAGEIVNWTESLQ